MEGEQGAEPTQFYKDDLVRKLSKSREVGVVLTVGGQDSDTSSSESDSDSGSEAESLSNGKVLVGWSSGLDEAVDVSKLKLLDRNFSHGEIVVNTSEALGQSGFIKNLELYVDLKYPDGAVAKNINSRDLRRVREFMKDDYVIQGQYIGRVDDVLDNVTLEFDNKAVCKVLKADPEMLCPAVSDEFSPDDLQCWFYPGLRVRASRASVLRHAQWIKGRSRWDVTCLEATVVRVETALVVVDWGSNTDLSDQQSPEKLVHLPHFSYFNWGINDHSLPVTSAATQENGAPSDLDNGPPADSASSSEVEEDPKDAGPLGRCRRKLSRLLSKRSRRKRGDKPPTECAAVITRTRTFADVVWQDGSRSYRIPTTLLKRSELYGWNDFWPESYVTERPPEAEEDDCVYRRVGIVKAVDPKQRTARVKWFKRVNSPLEPREVESEEVVSIFEIVDHPDYHYNIGDVVVRLTPVGEEEATPEGDMSWVGTILGCEDGDIEVEWGNGMVSKVGPHAIYVAHRVDDDDSSDTGDDTSSWETVESDDELKQKLLADGDAAVQDVIIQESGVVSMISDLSRRVVSLLGAAVGRQAADTHEAAQTQDASQGRETVATDPHVVEQSPLPELESPSEEEEAQTGDAEAEETQVETEESQQDERQEEENSAVEPEPEMPLILEDRTPDADGLKHFDAVKEAPEDHLLLSKPDPKSNNRKWVKKVYKEWSILQENLPDTIYVRIFENRMDLMRAIIVGAAGTPYHDGLFVFDICLPVDYPTYPPIVLYRSGGLMLNPNLYADGKICLSLLNTWRGKGSELWNPTESNLVQVLLSIQGLVLNAKPYFNEADYERYTGVGEAERNSVEYNESAFILTCKSMLYLLRRPPMHVEDVIKNHFRSRALRILATCKAYADGVPVGSPIDKPLDRKAEAPAGFKLLLDKLTPRLAAAFKEAGATGCEEYLAQNDSTES